MGFFLMCERRLWIDYDLDIWLFWFQPFDFKKITKFDSVSTKSQFQSFKSLGMTRLDLKLDP
jgi:hypothetical protein